MSDHSNRIGIEVNWELEEATLLTPQEWIAGCQSKSNNRADRQTSRVPRTQT